MEKITSILSIDINFTYPLFVINCSSIIACLLTFYETIIQYVKTNYFLNERSKKNKANKTNLVILVH